MTDNIFEGLNVKRVRHELPVILFIVFRVAVVLTRFVKFFFIKLYVLVNVAQVFLYALLSMFSF